jgi:LuxR family maltose regulon positive regulatory protein
MLRSRAFQKLRRLDESKIDLLSALNIGAKGGFCRVFLDAGEEIHSLLRLLIKNSSGDIPSGTIELLGKINKLLLVDHTSEVNDAPQFKPSAALLETLTKREMQMLDTIVTGQTNKEIADKLFISEQTVKWHLHQLYQKLGVRNRTSAIAKARTLALI